MRPLLRKSSAHAKLPPDGFLRVREDDRRAAIPVTTTTATRHSTIIGVNDCISIL